MLHTDFTPRVSFHLAIFLVCWMPSFTRISSEVHSLDLATLAIKILEFQDHEKRRMDGSCCGNMTDADNALCFAQCSLEFRICLEPFGIQVSVTDHAPYGGPCVYGHARTGHWGNTDTVYTFSEAQAYVINITTPWPRSFTVILEAYDLQNMDEKYLISRIVHHSLLRPVANAIDPVKGQPSEWHHVTTATQFSGYTFSMRLACRPDLYNNTCTKLCLKNSTQYTCDANGDKVCEPGWSGTNCDIAMCKMGCHSTHGRCSQPGECECAVGWQGPYCDECVKYPGCKHGVCDQAPFTCRCLPNWGGPFCDQDLDYCARHKPCRNGGICRNTNSTMNPFSCSCTREYTGDLCETKLPACSWNPCKRGRCVPRGTDDYQCECDPGWRGDHCEENIDYCLQNTCLNGGTCQDLDGVGFRCLCPPGFKGSNCQLRSPCGNSRCVHARDCTPLIPPVNGSDYYCICQPGWTGQFCEQNVDDCVDKCQNGGKCQDLLDDFYCICPLGSYGRYCEINRECIVNPCKNNGICHEIEGGYNCECPSGFTGHNCEVSLSSCNPNPCQNAAYCYTLLHGFYCKCSPEYYGQFCEHERPYCGPSGCAVLQDPCFVGFHAPVLTDSTSLAIVNSETTNKHWTGLIEMNEPQVTWNVCGPHGTCVSSDTNDGAYSCACSSGFQGKYCQEPINYCEGNPCMNGGTCVLGVDKFDCICEEGFTGSRCETPVDLCRPNPCRNGGYCQNTIHPGDFQCRCAPGWSGRLCQLRTDDPCSVSKFCFNNGVCHSDPLQPGGFRCECDERWMGSVCHLRHPDNRACVNETLCQNGATCIDIGDSFNCLCRPGFDGQYCENDINECNSMPCYNNGTCRDLINSYECECPKGFIGPDCRINIDECATNPCAFGATCVDKVADYQCICPPGRHGKNCDDVLVLQSPKPPACNFQDRIYDHNESWTYNCQKCHCNTGQVICEDDFCGYWSCVQAVGQSDRFACKPGEVCQILTSGFEGECFVPPCYLRTVCLNTTRSIPVQLRELLPTTQTEAAAPGCRPNAAQLTNRCARIELQFSKQRLPYGVTISDVCNAVRQLPTVTAVQTMSSKALGFGMSCDIKADRRKELTDVIEITLSSMDDRLKKNKNGQEYSFIHMLTRNISRDIVEKASTNVTLMRNSATSIPQDDSLPLPPMTQLLGTPDLEKYWHRILLGVVEIKVDTVVLKEKEFGSPILVPLACGLILVMALVTILFICIYAQRKHHELLLKYAPSMPPNNDVPTMESIMHKPGQSGKSPAATRTSRRLQAVTGSTTHDNSVAFEGAQETAVQGVKLLNDVYSRNRRNVDGVIV